MPTRWLDCQELHPPFDSGRLDENGRCQYVFNVNVYKHVSATLVNEVKNLLEDAGVGTLGTDIFATSKASIPDDDGPYLSIWPSGGATGVRTHNVTTGPTYERPSVQITVRGHSPSAVETMARAAYSALVGVRNQDVDDT